MFSGDRDCGDNTRDCAFPGVVARYRYLHVVLHDVPRSYDWAVTEGTACDGSATTLVSNGVLNADGYLESIVDLQTVAPDLQRAASCFIFRGREGYPETFYAAYLDDNPSQDADTILPGYKSLAGRPDLPDLDVTLIHRDPTYSYDARKNRPTVGDQVSWIATVRNAGSQPSADFSYEWMLNGRAVGTGQITNPLAPGSSIQFTLPLRWSGARDSLTFRVDPAGLDGSLANNELSVGTDAISLGIWVEQSAYEYFAVNQWIYCRQLACRGSNSFEDWLQRQVSHWNALFAASVYPGLAPTGVADRVRIDEIKVMPDGSLPLHGGAATNTPDLQDHTVDLEWGIPTQGVADQFRLRRDAEFDVDWPLIHELNHARSLADLYRFDVPVRSDQSIHVTALDGGTAFDQGNPPDTSAKLQAYSVTGGQWFLYRNQEQDLMSCTCTPTYSAYSVLVLNRLRGRRAVCGNVNEPCNLGDWFVDLPPRSALRVVDSNGLPLPDGAVVRLFFDSGSSYTGHTFSNTDSQSLPLRHGTAMLPADPFRAGVSHYLAGHNLLLVEVRTGPVDSFCFLEPIPFNMAYWEGYSSTRQTALFVLHMSQGGDNACRIDSPPPRLNEPFGASPDTSYARLVSHSVSGRTVRRVITVTLRDDQTPPIPLYGRTVVVRNANGKRVGMGTTGLEGAASISVPSGARGLRVVDVTDNNLEITPLRQVHQAQEDRSP
ncbi:MAG TPA: CARDB domain-containing protein [Chloroflexota bacterium]